MTQSPPDGPGPVQMPSPPSHPYPDNYAGHRRTGSAALPQHPKPFSKGGADNTTNGHTAQQRPIDAAVQHAFGDTQLSDIDQEALISRVTQQVLKQLHTNPGAFAFQGDRPLHPVTPVSPDIISTQFPPPAAPPPRHVYTPPSPHKATDFTAESPGSRRASSIQMSPKTSPRGSAAEPVSPKSLPPGADPEQAPQGSATEESPLEKIWGRLFDDRGMPTMKLSQLLRGTAMHLIECYEPKNTLVVTPLKMQQFYRDHPIPQEPYPWDDIFDDQESYISRMYRELECEHHLIQEQGHFYEKPDIPGLTPRGFQHWATLLILSHPDEAFQRFQSVVQGLPISNPDDRKERFPKKLPRKLFPTEPDLHVRERLVQAIEQHARVSIEEPESADTPRGQQPRYPKPPSSQRTSSPSRSEASGVSEPHSIERQRQPYSASMPKECAIDDTNPQPSSQWSKPIERARQPYSATPGGGRNFRDDDMPPLAHASTVPAAAKPASGVPPPPAASIHRANSTASATHPINIPPPPSIREREYPPPGYSPNAGRRASMARRRNHSPPPASFRASESDVAGFMPSSSHDGRQGFRGFDGFDNGRRHPPPPRDSESRRPDHARGPSPVKWHDRSSSAFEMENRRPSSFIAEGYYSRPRRDTIGSRPW